MRSKHRWWIAEEGHEVLEYGKAKEVFDFHSVFEQAVLYPAIVLVPLASRYRMPRA